MVLDPIAQRYAQTLYVDHAENITRNYAARVASVRAALAQRGILPHTSGVYYSEMTRIGIEHISELVDARVASVLAAYERAKLSIDNQVVAEIHDEAKQFCENQGRYLTKNICEQAGQAQMPPGVAEHVSATIAQGMSAIQARIHRKLSKLRDEGIMAARAVPGSVTPEGNGRTGDLITRLWDGCARWQWYGALFVGASGMISMQEYFLGVLLFFLSAVSLLSKLMHWNGRQSLKFLGAAGITCAFVLLLIIVVAVRGRSPWSHLQEPILKRVAFVHYVPATSPTVMSNPEAGRPGPCSAPL